MWYQYKETLINLVHARKVWLDHSSVKGPGITIEMSDGHRMYLAYDNEAIQAEAWNIIKEIIGTRFWAESVENSL
jgi:hypothetical protein